MIMTEDEKAKLEIDKAIKIVNAYNDGYKCGRADAIDEFSKWLFRKEYITTDNWEMWHLDREDIVKEFLEEQLKEQKNE